jgi:hypothetical protein
MTPQNMPPAMSPSAADPAPGMPRVTAWAVKPSMTPAMTSSDPVTAMPTQKRRVSGLT